MGDPAVAIGEAELQRIGEYVKGNLKEWIEQVQPAPDSVTKAEILERITRIDDRYVSLNEKSIRIEEELKSQRELMETRFTFVEQRFEDLHAAMEKRFDAADKRFEETRAASDKRFEETRAASDKRFEETQAATDKLFKETQAASDKRFEETRAATDKRFSLLTWMMGVGIATGLAIIGILVGT